jgi:predicted acetyltransferase
MGVLAFGEGEATWGAYYDPEKNPMLDLEAVYVIEEDGEVRASATVLPLEAFAGTGPVPMGGVAAVMTHPAYRRRGYAGELLGVALRGMRERGQHLSMLWPFAHAFYRRYGWELTGEAISYTLKPTELPTSPEQVRVRAYREGDLMEMALLLEKEASGHPLCVRRGEGRWRQVLGGGDPNSEGAQAAVYRGDGGALDGYLLYRQSGWREGREPGREFGVRELVARTPEAREALLSVPASLDPEDFEVKVSVPRGEPLHPFLRSSYVKAEVEPEFMVRLVDVGGALGLLRREIEAPLTLEVADDIVPENTGTYTVGGDGEVARGAEAPDRVALDVRQLAQLYAGYLPAAELARHGLVEPSSPRALGLLGALFPPGDPWVFPPDHF